jgi:hypothetical protein
VRSKVGAKLPSFRKIEVANKDAQRRRGATTNGCSRTLKAALNKA